MECIFLICTLQPGISTPGFTSRAELTILSQRPLAGRLAPAFYLLICSLSLFLSTTSFFLADFSCCCYHSGGPVGPLIPNQGSNLHNRHCKHAILTPGPPGKSPWQIYIRLILIFAFFCFLAISLLLCSLAQHPSAFFPHLLPLGPHPRVQSPPGGPQVAYARLSPSLSSSLLDLPWLNPAAAAAG